MAYFLSNTKSTSLSLWKEDGSLFYDSWFYSTFCVVLKETKVELFSLILYPAFAHANLALIYCSGDVAQTGMPSDCTSGNMVSV